MSNSNHTDRHVQLEHELQSMRELTMGVMKSSSDLGVVVRFLKASFSVPGYSALGELLIDAVTEWGLDAGVTLETYTGRLFMGRNGIELEEVVTAELKRHMLSGRLVGMANGVQINFPAASILVWNMPEDAERKGQLKDALVLLMEGVEARVHSLMLEEKSQEARKSKNEFFALMSHELRTPLNPIIGYASRLERKLGESVDRKHGVVIKAIRANAESLLRLINHIIDLGKLEAGEIALNRRKFYVSDAINQSLIKVEDFIDTRNLTIKKFLDPEMVFNADPIRFIDIAMSLIAYAAQASAQPTLEVRVSKAFWAGNDNLLLEIIDHGVPKSEVYKTRIFESGSEREPNSLYENNDLGVGLYLTKKLVELHGGSIILENTAEQRNSFKVYLPYV